MLTTATVYTSNCVRHWTSKHIRKKCSSLYCCTGRYAAFCFCFRADFMSVIPMKTVTKATSMITSTVGIAMAYFRGRKKSCTGCDVSTNGYGGGGGVDEHERQPRDRSRALRRVSFTVDQHVEALPSMSSQIIYQTRFLDRFVRNIGECLRILLNACDCRAVGWCCTKYITTPVFIKCQR